MIDEAKMRVAFAELTARVAVLEKQIAGLGQGGAFTPKVAANYELDGKYGDPPVKKNPHNWKGPSYEGQLFSRCPSELLLMLADSKEWQAGKNLEESNAASARGDGAEAEKFMKWSTYAKGDAAKARGWAARNEGKHFDMPDREEFNAPSDIPF